MKFTEEKLEQVFTELLENEGYPHYLGSTISRSEDEVLIEEDLKNYLLNRYKKEQLTVAKLEEFSKNLPLELLRIPF